MVSAGSGITYGAPLPVSEVKASDDGWEVAGYASVRREAVQPVVAGARGRFRATEYTAHQGGTVA